MEIAGKPVKDATKKVEFTITKRDVTTGATKDPAACAAAKACMRELGATEARVHLSRTYLKINNEWQRFQTPGAIRSEIIAFDRGGSFEPGDYTLRPLPKSERNKRGKAHSLGAPKHGRLGHHRKPHVVTNVRARGANR